MKNNNVQSILKGEYPSKIVYAPNYWQWFHHHKTHGTLPDEVKHCETQLDLINYLGLDVFSRNVYSDMEAHWFGGLCDEVFDGMGKGEYQKTEGQDKITVKRYTSQGVNLTETFRYIFNESTLVQKEFLVKDYNADFIAFEKFVASRKWVFNQAKYTEWKNRVGNGVVIAGELTSPLKMLHLFMGAVNASFFIYEQGDRAAALAKLHEDAQLDLIEQMMKTGVKVVMSMDNLDTMFHPPEFVEQYSGSFYSRASALCHDYGGKFMIHACGKQRYNLKLISSLGVDGLEGVAYPPLGDITLRDAFKLVHDRFIITGGISAAETGRFETQAEVDRYARDLFKELSPYANRFVFAASCQTAINTQWKTILQFRDAWVKYGDLI